MAPNTNPVITGPPCDCHGVPKCWNKDPKCRAGGHWRCRVKRIESVRRWEAKNRERTLEMHREKEARKRQRRRDEGVCLNCGGPLTSSTLCWDCLNRLEEQRALAL